MAIALHFHYKSSGIASQKKTQFTLQTGLTQQVMFWWHQQETLMWIRKSVAEVRAEKQTKLLRSTCLDVLLGTGLWYGIVQLSGFFGLPYSGPVSGCVACGVVAILLPASWFANRHSRSNRESTMVCDRCNALKTADDQPDCACGGTYLVLPEMRWVNPKPTESISMTKPESHFFARPVRWKLFRRVT